MKPYRHPLLRELIYIGAAALLSLFLAPLLLAQESCNPETYSSPGNPPLEIYRGPAGKIPEGVWSLKTPHFDTYMSHLKLDEIAPDFVEEFAMFLYEDFADDEPRFRQTLKCNKATASCNVYKEEVVGGKLVINPNGGRTCRPVMLTSIGQSKSVLNWDRFQSMLNAFDVRPVGNGIYRLFSAYCFKQNTFAGEKLFCEIDTPVDTPTGITQLDSRVHFSSGAVKGQSIRFAEMLYKQFEANVPGTLGEKAEVSWRDLENPNYALELDCDGPSDLSIPGFFNSYSYNHCSVKLKQTINGQASYIVQELIDLPDYDALIQELFAERNKYFEGEDGAYPIKRSGSFYFFDLKCSREGRQYKCSYKKL